MKTWKVSEKDAGERLVNFIRAKIGESFSARKVKQAIEHNHCKVNGYVERFASTKLRGGDSVQFNDEGLTPEKPRNFELEKSRILFEDDHLLIYNKPAGITSDDSGLGSLFPEYILIHRLDRDTTGVIAYAKHKWFFNKMVSLFRAFKVKKTYLALVDGVVKEKRGEIENHIGMLSKKGNEIIWGIVSPKKGKLAKTKWNLEKKGRNASLIKCFPITGRTHQVRLHLRELGHPILGDYRYAKKFSNDYAPKRCMLHALELTFKHPETEERINVRAPIPPDFKETIKKLI